jgi:hypothetical protein
MLSLRAFTMLLSSYSLSCQSPRVVLVKNYEQAKKLVPQYERQYSKNRRPTPWLGPPPAPVLRLRRTHSASLSVLLGHVDLVLENGKAISQPAAAVVIDEQIITADAAGNYILALPPGQHTVRSGGIGFLWSQALRLQVAVGDSIQLNFRLLSDPRPIID